MTSSTLLSRGALAAILVAGGPVAPAAVAQSADKGPTVKDPARANVYVPPSPDAATRLGLPQGTTQDLQLPDARKTANVYVPPVQAGLPGAPQRPAPKTANVYVPPVQAGLPGAPQRPAHTQAVSRASRPSADDGASPWAVIGLALGCAALLGGAGLALVHRAGRERRAVA